MLLVVAAVLLGGAVFLVLDAATAPSRDRRALVRRAARYGQPASAAERETPPLGLRVIAPVQARLASWLLRASPRQTIEDVSAKLLAAGMRTSSPQAFLAAKVALGLGGLALGALLGSSGSPLMLVLLAGVLAAGGFIAPGWIVSVRARRRKESIRSELPDALDLLAVSVEAGMGFDAAISKLIEHAKGPLAEELELALGEMRVGESRQEALRRMARRTATPELGSFVRAVIQADQLGTSLGRILRVQAVDARLKRQAAAEERALKAPIKMLFPTVLFIFPAMFIVVLGPAMLSLGKTLGF